MSKVEAHNSEIIDDLFDSTDPGEMERTRQKMLLAAKIEDAMKAKGWKKKDLMSALEIKSPSIVTRWFSGTHNFKTDTLIDLQSVLGVNLLNVEKENLPLGQVKKYTTSPVKYTIHCVDYESYPSFGGRKFSLFTTGFPVFSSSSSRAFFAIFPPFFPATLFSFIPSAFMFSAI